MPPPLHPHKRQQIVDAIEAGGTRNAIARDLGCSPSTVTRIAQEDNLDTSAWDRDSIKRASEAAAADIAQRKKDLARLLMDDAFDLRERMWESQQQVLVVGNGPSARTELVSVQTSAGDFRNYLTAIGIAVDKIAVLTRDDSQGVAAVDAWLHSLGVGQTAT